MIDIATSPASDAPPFTATLIEAFEPDGALTLRGLEAGAGIRLEVGIGHVIVAADPLTAANIGDGVAVYHDQIGNELQFRTLVAGDNIVLTQNNDTVRIDAAVAVHGSNRGDEGAEVFATRAGNELQFRRLVAGANTTLVQTVDTIEIHSESGEKNRGRSLGDTHDGGHDIYAGMEGVYLRFKKIFAGPNISISDNGCGIMIAAGLPGGGTGGGEINSGMNVGSGRHVFAGKIGTMLNFRTLVAAGGTRITTVGDEIHIDAAGEDNAAQNVGSGIGLFQNKVGEVLEFRTLVEGDGITLTQLDDEVIISSAAGQDISWESIPGKPNFASVAYSGNYADLIGLPEGLEAAWEELSGRPEFANVAFTGDFLDLVNVPDFTASWDDITDKPSLAEVAFSGDYNDLSNLPVIPDLDNLNVAWDDVQDKPIFAQVALSGSYNDLTDLPDLGVTWDDVEDKPAFAPVAYSVNYLTLSPSVAGTALIWNGSAYTWGSTAVTGVSLGSGAGVYAGSTGSTLQFRSLTSASSYLTVSASGDNVVLSASLGTAAAANTGTMAGNVPVLDVTGKIPASLLTLPTLPSFGTVVTYNAGYLSGQVPYLDAGGRLPSSVIPSILVTDVKVVGTLAARNALPAPTVGDVAIVTENSKTYVYDGAAWQEILTSGSVQSVNNKIGVVNLTAADITGFATVATSGSYADLSNKPILATVATTGSYNDLLNRPVLGEINTASNVGTGIGTFASKVGADLQFKSLKVGPGLTLAASATEITLTNSVAAGEVNTGSNVGTGSGVFAQKAGADLQFKSLRAGTGVSLTGTATDITIADTGTASNLGTGSGVFSAKVGADYQFKTIKAGSGITLTATGTEITVATAAAAGEVNTGSNLGTGTGMFAQKTGVDLQFKSLKPGAGVTLTSTATEVTVASTGEANTASNVGTGSGVFATKSGVDLQFKSIKAGTGVAVTATATEVTIASSSVGETNTASNVGTGTAVFAQKAGVDLQFKTLKMGSGLSVAASATEITLSSTVAAGEVNTASNMGGLLDGEGLFAAKSGVDLQFRRIKGDTEIVVTGPAFPATPYVTLSVGPTIARRNVAQTYTAQQNVTIVQLTSATSTVQWNLNAGNVASMNLVGNITLANPTNQVAGGTYVMLIRQDSVGNRTVTFGTAYKWPNNTVPTLSTSPSTVSILSFFSDGTNMYGAAVTGYPV